MICKSESKYETDTYYSLDLWMQLPLYDDTGDNLMV